MKAQFDKWKVELEQATKVQIEQMKSASQGVIQVSPATQAAEQRIARDIQ